MAPPTATYTEVASSDNPIVPSDGFNKPDSQPNGTAPNEPGLKQGEANVKAQFFPSPPKFTDKYEEREYLKGRLALAFRIFGKLGFDEGVAGHITLRDPVDPHTFWVNPFGLAFSMIKKSDLILVDDDGKVIDGGPNRLLNTAAYMIHAAVHRARPDVICAAHSHSIYGRSFCTLGRPIDIITQDSCAFHSDLAVYNSFKGVVLAKEEGENIARAIGNKKACLLQNHGLLTCAQTVEAALFWFVSLEKCCHAQLMADAACAGRGGATVKIDEEDAAFTYKSVGTPRAGWFSALPAFDLMARECGDEYLK
jgi:ribulose-5-phosphate 4-epimerase/fuculose-1-phosphate aldolase